MKQGNKKIRIIIDTNLCISMLIGKRVTELRPILTSPSYELIVSNTLLQEIRIVTSRPKFARYFDPSLVEDFIYFIQVNSRSFILDHIPSRCRDPKDDFLLELAIISDADLLLTGDKDLLELHQIGNCKIITINQFAAQYL